MEGFISETHSTPFVLLADDTILDWRRIKGMIETGDFRGISEDTVIKACKKLQETINNWTTDDNIGPDGLPPANYPCVGTQLIGTTSRSFDYVLG